jgi:4-hydroxyacetophenone monooxygenase
MFMLLGPTTSLAHGGSVLFHTEAQVRYIASLLSTMVNSEIGALECTEEACLSYTAKTDAAHSRLVFSHPGMSNWYKNRAGRVVTVSPWRLVDYWSMTRTPVIEDFISEPAHGAQAVGASTTPQTDRTYG